MNAKGVRELLESINMSIRASFNGSLGRNAEVKVVGDTKVTKFSVASNSGYGDKKKTYWVDCDLWGNRGEKLANYLTKGQAVLVYGEMDLNVYQAKDGTTKASFKCRVTDIELIGKKSDNEGDSGASQSNTQAPDKASDFDDDIPF